MTAKPSGSPLERRPIIFAVSQAPGATVACAARGDAAMAALLTAYYAMIARSIEAAEGRVIKVMGDSVLMIFPVACANQAVAILRVLQEQASTLWRDFDPRCHIQVKVGAGQVMIGDLGPPGSERLDICGDAVNRLFKLPWTDFVQTDEIAALVN